MRGGGMGQRLETHIKVDEVFRDTDIENSNNVGMVKTIKNRHFSQNAFAIDKIFKNTMNLLDGHNPTFRLVESFTYMPIATCIYKTSIP